MAAVAEAAGAVGGGRRGRGGGRGGGGRRSDIELKEDVTPLMRLDNGLELYRFRYKGSDPTLYVGVMAQEVQKIDPSAVSRDRDGYLLVDYDRLGLKFMTWEEWIKRSVGEGVPMMRKMSRILLCAALLGWSVPAAAQELFKTPEEAASALVGAAKSGEAKAILAVLGPDGKAIVASGDPVADSNAREKFIAAYDAKHALELEGDGTQTLILGDDDWPFPIPLVNKGGEWQVRHQGGRGRDLAPARRPQRAFDDPSRGSICPGAERICRARSRRT